MVRGVSSGLRQAAGGKGTKFPTASGKNSNADNDYMELSMLFCQRNTCVDYLLTEHAQTGGTYCFGWEEPQGFTLIAHVWRFTDAGVVSKLEPPTYYRLWTSSNIRLLGPKSRSEGLCLCRTIISGRMAVDGGDCVVQVVSAFSDENLCVLHLPSSSTVLDIKRHMQASHGINIFRQRLLVSPAGYQVEDQEVLAALPGIRLQLIRLEYADEDADGLRCLLRSAGEGNAPEVERLLRLPLRPDCSQAEDGATALILASGNGHLEVARLLWDAGADKDKARQDGATALILASYYGRLEVARLLCEAGADKDKATQDGDTALILASENGHLEVARLLWDAGADKDKARQDGATALTGAAYNGHLEVARLLCEAGADKDKAMQDGSTALIWASSKGQLLVARLLCEAGANKDQARQDGATALILASHKGHLEVARLLCEAGADRDKAGQDGATALILASSKGHLEVARLLCEAGADKDKAIQDVPRP